MSNIICNFCDERVGVFFEFSEHLVQEHGNEKGFFCPLAGCEIDIAEPLEQHFKKVHEFHCVVCTKLIDSEKERNNHSFTHFKCFLMLCDNEFSNRVLKCFTSVECRHSKTLSENYLCEIDPEFDSFETDDDDEDDNTSEKDGFCEDCTWDTVFRK